ncbi:MAG: cell wall hydrolase [Caulobacteraceae bacterium]
MLALAVSGVGAGVAWSNAGVKPPSDNFASPEFRSALAGAAIAYGRDDKAEAVELPPLFIPGAGAKRAKGPRYPSARAFTLPAGGTEREKAVECLTAAVYYEAANEPDAGQQAVAQVVLNRVRSPAYPKSVCGVVFQGSERRTGCQFTFTCDGSLYRKPSVGGWARAKAVAEAALDGRVAAGVSTATHYHASYVHPYWGPTLVKLGQIGAHIFYRSPGRARALAYAGGEGAAQARAGFKVAGFGTRRVSREAPVGTRSGGFTVWGLSVNETALR